MKTKWWERCNGVKVADLDEILRSKGGCESGWLYKLVHGVRCPLIYVYTLMTQTSETRLTEFSTI